MTRNELALRCVIRWRKVYGFRNRTKMRREDVITARYALAEHMAEKKRKGALG